MATARRFRATNGLDNNSNTITGIGSNNSTLNLAGNLTTSGAFAVTLTATATTSLTLPTSGTLVGTNDTGTVTSTMIANGTIVDGDISNSAAIAVSKLASSSVTVNGTAITLGGSGTITANTPNSFTLKFDSGTTEGTDQYTFNGGTAKTVNIVAGTNVTLTETSGQVTISATGGISGTGASGRMTYWDGTTSVTSDADLTYDASGNVLTAGLAKIGTGASTNAAFGTGVGSTDFAVSQSASGTFLNAASGQTLYIRRANSSTNQFTYDGSYFSGEYDGSNFFRVRPNTFGGSEFILGNTSDARHIFTGPTIVRSNISVEPQFVVGWQDYAPAQGANPATGVHMGVRVAQTTGVVTFNAEGSGPKFVFSDNVEVPDITVSGNLTVNGTTTNINTTNLVVEDKNIIVGDVATPSNTTADGGGITLKGATDKTINWVNATSAWTSSEDFNLLAGKVYEINGTSVLSATTLGSGVTDSSLTSVGTITSGTWSATTIATNRGGTGLTSFASGGAVYATSTSALTTGTLPVASGGTGITSFGTGVATALGGNVTGSGGIVLATQPDISQPNISSPFLTGTVSIGGFTRVFEVSTTTTTVSQTALTITTTTAARSFEIILTSAEGTNYQVTKLLAVHNGTTVFLTEYGTVLSNTAVASYDVDISGGNLRLLITSASANSTTHRATVITTG